ncbi:MULTISPECIES: replicative DNA helicase [unclassified Luteococcus]|uniref:replicative DNA helicase n=1 Tax=Luteococcus sp. H154 TaxID=3139403 RepID=UPI00313F1528
MSESSYEAPPQGGGIDRTPPQDLAAEQSVLGAMLMSKDAIADVVEVLKGRDFYRPAHELIYDAILDLYGRGEPADPVTVADELGKRGEISKVGGHVYLADLLSSVSIAANAGYYAEIVRDKAVLRRLVEASIKIAQMGYQGQGDVTDIVDAAQQTIYEVSEGKTSDDYKPLSMLIEPAIDEIESIANRGGEMSGVPTGFAELDDLTNGLHAGQMIIIAARPAVGKALALDTKLPTPTGWTTMGEVQVGDELLTADGRPTRVVAATEVMTDRPCYRITFSDGTQIVADAEHEWPAAPRALRRQPERRPDRHHYSDDGLAHLDRLRTISLSKRFTIDELTLVCGSEFKNPLHVVGKQVGTTVKEPRLVIGPRRTYMWNKPTYDSDVMVNALWEHTSKPINGSQRATHTSSYTTQQLAQQVRLADGRCNWSVPLTKPLDLPGRELLVDPYVLGVWLGDGHTDSARFTSADPEIARFVAEAGYQVTSQGSYLYGLALPRPRIIQRECAVCGEPFLPKTAGVRTCGRTCGGRLRFIAAPAPALCSMCGKPFTGSYTCATCRKSSSSVQAQLRTLGVLGAKHIPADYLRGSSAQRRALLAGLMDTDGTVLPFGSFQLVLTDARLAADAYELIVSLGIRCGRTSKTVRGRDAAHSVAHVLTFTAPPETFRLERKRARAEERRRSARSLAARYVTDVEAIESVPVRCVQIDDPSHLYLASESMIPTHNSTLALDFARAAAIKHKLTTAFFSLEMSQTEIVMRLLSAEAQVPLNHIRGGKMTEEDWSRVVRKTAQVSEAPFFIDDSPNLTMMEIRAKARRLKQRHDLKLVIIDYMQLMTSGKKVESRQLEVSEFSRQIKLLAKELQIPVIALSQLNRGPEQRTDKKPMLSDLRESGCLTASTRVLRADTGAEITMGELLESGAQNIPVWSLDEQHKLVAAPMTHAFPSGTKPVFRLTLTSGRVIEATANHPFLTWDGWMPLGELVPGARLATPRLAPEPLEPSTMDEDELVLLAHLIGDGSFVKRQPIRYASIDKANLQAVADAAARRFGITGVRDEYAAARVTTLRLPAPFRLTHGRRNPVAVWLDELGLFGLRSHEKFVPTQVFQTPNAQVAAFLRHLWATDGSVRWDDKAGQARIYYATTSRRLADDIARLLLRFGIVARLKTARKSGYRDGYHVIINGVQQQKVFCERIGVHGVRGAKCDEVYLALANVRANTNLDTVPRDVWELVRSRLTDQGMTHRAFAQAMDIQFCGSTLWKHAPSRERLGRVATLLADPVLDRHATSDVYWDAIKSVEPLGEQPVYDATVLGTHNFIADGIIVHNSLEQDADMVILLHRDDVYDKESSRAGEADLIVAKHRNGRTDTVVTAFQGHYSRFVDMQH